MNLHGVCYGEGDLSYSYLVFEFPSNGCLRPRLHRNTIFGVVSVSDTCRTPERVRIARFRCSVCVLFFFFFFLTRINVEPTRPKRQQWRKKKKKITDFEFEKSFWETHLSKFSTHPRSDLCRCPLSLAGARSGWSASSIDVEWCRALSLMAISLYLGVDNRSDPLSFFFFFFFWILILVSEW